MKERRIKQEQYNDQDQRQQCGPGGCDITEGLGKQFIEAIAPVNTAIAVFEDRMKSDRWWRSIGVSIFVLVGSGLGFILNSMNHSIDKLADAQIRWVDINDKQRENKNI